jgi:hypothetical protein
MHVPCMHVCVYYVVCKSAQIEFGTKLGRISCAWIYAHPLSLFLLHTHTHTHVCAGCTRAPRCSERTAGDWWSLCTSKSMTYSSSPSCGGHRVGKCLIVLSFSRSLSLSRERALSLSRVLSIYLSNMLTRSLSHARALCFLRSQKSSTCNYRIRERASEQKSSSEQKSIALSHCSLARSRTLPLWA